MLRKIIFILIAIFSLSSCQENIALLSQLDTSKDIKFYFISSEIMGPNSRKNLSEFQTKNHSFYIDDKQSIEYIKEHWVYPSTKEFDNFIGDYTLIYTENGKYKGKISIDLEQNIAISGYGPTTFNETDLKVLEKKIKPLETRFFSFQDLNEARLFYSKIQNKNWLLPSPNDKEYYKWTEFEGECIIKINNKKFARDRDIEKALKKYLPKQFVNDKFYYNVFRFTTQNSTIRMCSNKDLSKKFPEDFHVIIPWKKYNNIIIPLVNFEQQKLQEILFAYNIKKYTIINKIE